MAVGSVLSSALEPEAVLVSLGVAAAATRARAAKLSASVAAEASVDLLSSASLLLSSLKASLGNFRFLKGKDPVLTGFTSSSASERADLLAEEFMVVR